MNDDDETVSTEPVWTKCHENILIDWADKAMCYRWLHARCNRFYHLSHIWLTIPVILFSIPENFFIVTLDILSDSNTIQITWRVKKSKDRYFVIDLLVADISLVVTKRSEFNSMLKTIDYNLVEFNKILVDQNEVSYQKIIK